MWSNIIKKFKYERNKDKEQKKRIFLDPLSTMTLSLNNEPPLIIEIGTIGGMKHCRTCLARALDIKIPE